MGNNSYINMKKLNLNDIASKIEILSKTYFLKEYGYFSEQLIELQHKQAQFCFDNKGEGKIKMSDKTVEFFWMKTKDGKDLTRTTQTIKFLEECLKLSKIK